MLSETTIDRLCVDFGGRVRSARQRAGLTPKALAELVGLSRSSIANLEAGRQRVPVHIIWNLAETLGVPVAELLPEPGLGSAVPRPEVNRILKQEPRLEEVSRRSRRQVREFVEAKLADMTATPSEPED